MKSILTITDLHIWYKNLEAVKGMSMLIPEHHVTALIGASGSGKSSFLRSLNRMVDLVSGVRVEGSICYEGRNILDKDTDVIGLRRHIGMVFQNPTPFPKSIFDNIAYGLEVQGIGRAPRRSSWWGGNKKSTYAQVATSDHPIDRAVVKSLTEAALWEEVKDRLHHPAMRLSGGQQQRLCIARAIAVRPKVLLLDEPCSDLDPISTAKIEQLILNLKKDYTIIIVTHNLQQAKRVADYVGFFHLGELVEFDETAKIFSDPRERLTREYTQGQFG